MRILYFSKDYCPHDHRFLSALAESGNEIFYLRLEQGDRQTEIRPVPDQVEQVSWSGGRSPARLVDGPRLVLELNQILSKIKPDILHAGPIQTCGLLAALSGFHPLLIMSWGFDLLKDIDRGPEWRWASRYTLRHADWFTSDCETTRQIALQLGVPAGRTTVFPWGVDLDHFTPQPRPDAPGRSSGFTLFCNRSWEPNYGVDVLAQAFVQVANQRTDIRLRLLGGGSQADKLQKIFTSAGVADRVDLAGQVGFADLPGFYRQVDLYVSASHVDGSSVSLMEALACGLPCLVSDIPANREWVSAGQNGWLFPDGDVQALSARILKIVDDRESLVEIGLYARQIAESRADWKKNFPLLLAAYQSARDHWTSRQLSRGKS